MIHVYFAISLHNQYLQDVSEDYCSSFNHDGRIIIKIILVQQKLAVSLCQPESVKFDAIGKNTLQKAKPKDYLDIYYTQLNYFELSESKRLKFNCGQTLLL